MIDTPDTVNADDTTDQTVRCDLCRRPLRLGPNGPKAIDGGYTCWARFPGESNPKHIPERPLSRETAVGTPMRMDLEARRQVNLSLKLEDTAQQLRATPRTWKPITVADAAPHRLSTVAYKINKGKWAAFRPAHWFEANVRDGALWVRYVGDDEKLSA